MNSSLKLTSCHGAGIVRRTPTRRSCSLRHARSCAEKMASALGAHVLEASVFGPQLSEWKSGCHCRNGHKVMKDACLGDSSHTRAFRVGRLAARCFNHWPAKRRCFNHWPAKWRCFNQMAMLQPLACQMAILQPLASQTAMLLDLPLASQMSMLQPLASHMAMLQPLASRMAERQKMLSGVWGVRT